MNEPIFKNLNQGGKYDSSTKAVPDNYQTGTAVSAVLLRNSVFDALE